MKSAAFLIVALVITLCVVVHAVKVLVNPIIAHFHAKWRHHRMIEERRERFYKELGMLMRDRSALT